MFPLDIELVELQVNCQCLTHLGKALEIIWEKDIHVVAQFFILSQGY